MALFVSGVSNGFRMFDADSIGVPMRETCFSLFPGYHFDRAVIATLGTKVCRFAEVTG